MLIYSLKKKKIRVHVFISFSVANGLEIVELSKLETSAPCPLGSHPLMAVGDCKAVPHVLFTSLWALAVLSSQAFWQY